MRMIPPPADGKAVLETELWGRNVTYVRHGDADAGDCDARRESVETSRADISAEYPPAFAHLRSAPARSEARRVGKECVSPGRSRCATDHDTNKSKNNTEH